MRRTAVQTVVLHARQLLLPASRALSPALAPPPKRPSALLAGAGYVCADCRRHLVGGPERRRPAVPGKRRPRSAGLHADSTPPPRAADSLVPETEDHRTAEDGLHDSRRIVAEDGRPPRAIASDTQASIAEQGRWGLEQQAADPPPRTPTESLDAQAERVCSDDGLPDLERRDPATFALLLLQSEVNAADDLLVDRPRFRDNWKLWRSLLLFRKRVHGDVGVKDVWRGMRHRGLQLPIAGDEADAIWLEFVATACHDDQFAEELIAYAEDMSECSNHMRQWAPLYDCFMEHHLVNLSIDTLSWHLRLFPTFTSQNYGRLFSETAKRQDVPKLYFLQMRILATLHQPGLYKHIITDLCSRNKFHAALVKQLNMARRSPMVSA